jgi:hypothetical protein
MQSLVLTMDMQPLAKVRASKVYIAAASSQFQLDSYHFAMTSQFGPASLPRITIVTPSTARDEYLEATIRSVVVKTIPICQGLGDSGTNMRCRAFTAAQGVTGLRGSLRGEMNGFSNREPWVL